MKIRFLLCSIVFSLTFSVLAQDFQLGLKGTPLIGLIRTDTENYESSGAKLGFSYGLLLDSRFSDNYSIATEFAISTFGGKFSYDTVDTRVKSTYSVQYLEIPMTLKLRTNDVGYMSYYGQFGFGVGFRLKARADYEFEPSNSQSFEDRNDIEITDEVAPIRVALHIGAGAEYALTGNTKILFGLLFSNGFTDIDRESNVSIKNSYISLNTGILF